MYSSVKKLFSILKTNTFNTRWQPYDKILMLYLLEKDGSMIYFKLLTINQLKPDFVDFILVKLIK